MGLLTRLRRWVRSAVGSGDVVESPVEGAGTYDYECSVCGTGVDEPDADCPLCRSSDVVASGTGPPPAAATGVDAGRGAVDAPDTGGFDPGRHGGDRDGRATTPPAADVEGRKPVRQHVAPTDDEAVQRLRDLRDGGELLERHADRWEPHPGGFRVETATGTRIVDSREEVVALLRATDR